MYNNQNNIRDTVPLPKTVPESGSNQNKNLEGPIFDRGKSSGVLKVFGNSEETSHISGRFKNPKRKSLKHVTSKEREFLGEKSKTKNGVRKKTKEDDKSKRKMDYYDILTTQFLNDNKREGKQKIFVESVEVLKGVDQGRKTGLEVHNASTLQGKEEEMPDEKEEAALKQAHFIPSNALGGKALGKTSEVKTTNSEIKKFQINEILKDHAQKVQLIASKSSQPVKDYSFQGVIELLEKVKKLHGENNKETKAKFNKNEGKEESEKRRQEKKLENAKRKDGEGGKKINNKWMKIPQSKELERRLNGSWNSPKNNVRREKQAKPKKESAAEEKKNEGKEEEKKVERREGKEEGSEEKVEERRGEKREEKQERRTTYTDRLVTWKREKGEKKSMAEDYTREESKTEDKNAEKVTSNQVAMSEPSRGNSTSDCGELPLVRGVRLPAIEQIYKAKNTRSTELRDLVVQAVKDHKIFCIFDNHWYIVRPVREELLSRGWLEVIPDRRLIPRRRPPPPGPTSDRTISDRNSCTLEAILTIREAFTEEIQESVSKLSSFKIPNENKIVPYNPNSHRKISSESLGEAASLFRIVPPTGEKKKTNYEIREFLTRCYYKPDKDGDKKTEEKDEERESEKEKVEREKLKEIEKEKEREIEKEKEREKIRLNRIARREKYLEQFRNQKAQSDKNSPVPVPFVLRLHSRAFHESNQKTIIQMVTDLKRWDVNDEPSNAISAKPTPAVNSTETEEKVENVEKEENVEKVAQTTTTKPLFTDSEAKTISKTIQSMNARIQFMWLSIKPSIHLKCFNYSPEIINKFQRTTFCTKIGLWSHLNNIQWHGHEVHHPAKSPRMYNTGEADDLQAFFQDFQLTACIGILKWLADTFFDRGIKAVQTKKGKVPLKAFEFAIKQCERYIRFKDNEDLSLNDEPRVLKDEWNTFLQWFYIITNDHGKLQECSGPQLMVVYTKAVETLRAMRKYWPEIDIDGRLNIWIIKPYCASCGRGIFMTNNVYYIGQHSKYIVQKYIERPLLIYNTKFDIRQWFMLTKLTPLEIWMYKECYLRFCTQPFALKNLHESVHLSNNSVQRKYINYQDPSLPDQNMWDSNTFQLYLKTIGHSNIWHEIIYPGMRDAIVSTMLSAQDTFDGPRKSWFEVYGADFMLSANLKEGPWLIEINENPAMDPSTKVTARLCPQMLRDVIKVVVDKRTNKNANTGQWELIYRQNYSPSFSTVDLDVKGKKILGNTKQIIDLPQHPLTSPTVGRKSCGEETDTRKLYEVVKSYSCRQNSKGDTNEITTYHSLAPKFCEQVREPPPYESRRRKSKVHVQNSMQFDDKFKYMKDKKEEIYDGKQTSFRKALLLPLEIGIPINNLKKK